MQKYYAEHLPSTTWTPRNGRCWLGMSVEDAECGAELYEVYNFISSTMDDNVLKRLSLAPSGFDCNIVMVIEYPLFLILYLWLSTLHVYKVTVK